MQSIFTTLERIFSGPTSCPASKLKLMRVVRLKTLSEDTSRGTLSAEDNISCHLESWGVETGRPWSQLNILAVE